MGAKGIPVNVYDIDDDGVARPVMRAYSPVKNPQRTFPGTAFILNPQDNATQGEYQPRLFYTDAHPTGFPGATCPTDQTCIISEHLPTIARTMNFRVSARDLRGGVADAGTTVSAGERRLPSPPGTRVRTVAPLGFSVANEMLPSPGPYALRLYTDNPTISLSAQQGIAVRTFPYNWLSMCTGGTTPPPNPPSGPFAITSVTPVSCVPVAGDANRRSLTFTPRYSGTTGQPISFSVANEMRPTTAPGPYTLGVYIDNPVITLKARRAWRMKPVLLTAG